MSNVQALPRAAPLHRGIIDIGASSHVWVHVDGRRHRLQRRGRNHHVVEAVTSSSPTVDRGLHNFPMSDKVAFRKASLIVFIIAFAEGYFL